MTMWLELVATWTGTDSPMILQDLPQQLHSSVGLQQQLGWEQIYQGRVLTAWAQAIDDLHPTLAPLGTQVMIGLIHIVWTYILDVWKTRNQPLHNSASQLNLPDYQQVTTTLYKLHHQPPPNTQTALYHQPLEQLLEQLAPWLQCWVQTGYKYFFQQTKAAKKQAALHTLDIRMFFCTQTRPN